MKSFGVVSLGKRLLGLGRAKPQRRRPRVSYRFGMEPLEGRNMLATYTMPLVNQTGLDPSQYAIYTLGFSTASQLVLQANGEFGSFSGRSGQIPSYKVGAGSGQLSTITWTDQQTITGAIVYFFVVPLPVAAAPYLTYSNSGSSVTQPSNPPSNQLPNGQGAYVYQFVELTQPASGLPTVDVSEVNGFVMPINVTLNGGQQVGQPLYTSGQTPVVNRAAIFTEYNTFTAQISSPTLRQAYRDLTVTSSTVAGQPIAILNPGVYLASGANPTSPLNTYWDATLTTLFTTPSNLVGMIGDDNAYYQGTPTQLGSGQWVLHFVGYTDAACTMPNGNVYNIYSPLTPDPLGSYQLNETSGEMVFANDGVFADTSANVIQSGPAFVALGLQRDIVSALNRGVALLGPTDGLSGGSSVYWGTETNWYPAGQTYNFFSWFMHVAQIGGQNIFVVPASTSDTAPPVPATDAQGNPMGQAYGFAYDESPPHPAPPTGYTHFPNVPSKFDPVPAGTTTVTVTFGPWTSQSPPAPATQYVAVGSAAGGPSLVKVYASNQPGQIGPIKTLRPFGDFKGGVRVATGDVNGDGTEDVITAIGPGGRTRVKVYDGTNFALLYQFIAFPQPGAQRAHPGVFVASADVNNDGHADIVVGADAGWLPVVRVYSGTDGAFLHQFFAFGNKVRGGVRVAAGDIDKDGFSEIIVGSGRGSAVRVFDGRTYAARFSFNPYQGIPNRDGVFVAIGDVHGDDNLDIVTGTGPKVAAQSRVFDATDGHYVDQVFRDPNLRVGIPLGLFDWDGDGKDEVFTGRGPGRLARVDIWHYDATTLRWLNQGNFLAFNNKHGESIG